MKTHIAMKIEKNNTILMLWIKHDPDLWSELRPIQIRLLLDRIVKEKSYAEMALEHGTTQGKMRLIFGAILMRIERFISSAVAAHFRTIDALLEQRPERPFSVCEIYLN